MGKNNRSFRAFLWIALLFLCCIGASGTGLAAGLPLTLGQYYASWVQQRDYPPGSIVQYNGNVYIALNKNSGVAPPTNIQDWALLSASAFSQNSTAGGAGALVNNTTGTSNTAFGTFSLTSNVSGGTNTAFGDSVLFNNTTGAANSAFGQQAL